MEKIIKKIAESEVRQDSNGRNYKLVTFSTPDKDMVTHSVLGPVLVSVEPKTINVVQREIRYLDNKSDLGWTMAIGEWTKGDILTKIVAPYTITGSDNQVREVNTDTALIFGDSTSEGWENKVASVFAQRKLARDKAANPEMSVEQEITSKPSTAEEIVSAEGKQI